MLKYKITSERKIMKKELAWVLKQMLATYLTALLRSFKAIKIYTHTHTHTQIYTHTHIIIYFLPAYQHTQLFLVPWALRFQFPDLRLTIVQDLKAVNINTTVICSLAPCIFVHGYQLFGTSRDLSHRGRREPYAPHIYIYICIYICSQLPNFTTSQTGSS